MDLTPNNRTNHFKLIVVYVLMIGGVLLAYLAIRRHGEGLSPALPVGLAVSHGSATSSPPDVMRHVLLALIVVIILARALGALFRPFHQPPVIGEIIDRHPSRPLGFRTARTRRGIRRAALISGA